jgi:hypothetical protein
MYWGEYKSRPTRVAGGGPAEEVTEKDGIPVTAVARTLLDLADDLDMQGVRRAVTEAEYRHLYDHTALVAVVESNPGVGSTGRAPRSRTRS